MDNISIVFDIQTLKNLHINFLILIKN